MTKKIQTVSNSFRCTPELSSAITKFANQSNKQVFSIIREAVESHLNANTGDANMAGQRIILRPK